MSSLTPVQQKYVHHWGDLGAQWGIDRTVAQIHALLFISPRPRNAGEIARALEVSQGEVERAIEELTGWGIVRRIDAGAAPGERYESIEDVWEMFRIILDQRKKREIDPTVEILRQCLSEMRQEEGEESRYAQKRMGELQEFLETTSAWYEQVSRMPTPLLIRFVKAGDSIAGFFRR